MSGLNRRQFLQAGGATAFLVLFGGLATGCQIDTWDQLKALGNLYIARVPAEGTQAALAPLLGNPKPDAKPHAMFINLANQIIADYDAGRVVWINCYCYPVTGLRIAAFWALAPVPATTTTTAPVS